MADVRPSEAVWELGESLYSQELSLRKTLDQDGCIEWELREKQERDDFRTITGLSAAHMRLIVKIVVAHGD